MVLIARENGLLRNVFGGVAALVLIPIAIIIRLIAMPFDRPAKRTPHYVADCLRRLLSDDPEADRYWDEFTSVPIANPELEAIREAAELVQLPVDEAGRAKLEALLARAETLVVPSLSTAGETRVH